MSLAETAPLYKLKQLMVVECLNFKKPALLNQQFFANLGKSIVATPNQQIATLPTPS